MPFAKRGDVVHSEATSGFNNQKKSLLINGLAALGDSLYPLHIAFQHDVPATSSQSKGALAPFFVSAPHVDLAHGHLPADPLQCAAGAYACKRNGLWRICSLES
ncbi:TPA: hypothetical protein QEM76_004653 [Pseudomonas putida]|nr:hypothetical protein [Pseudomonas putida]HDS1807898.1 hypothetical protein [Pseudomonas putida]